MFIFFKPIISLFNFIVFSYYSYSLMFSAFLALFFKVLSYSSLPILTSNYSNSLKSSSVGLKRSAPLSGTYFRAWKCTFTCPPTKSSSGGESGYGKLNFQSFGRLAGGSFTSFSCFYVCYEKNKYISPTSN
jgi:hypothetical protein